MASTINIGDSTCACAIICQVAGFDLGKMLYISSGNNMFGTYSAELLADAKEKLEGWFPAPLEGLHEPT